MSLSTLKCKACNDETSIADSKPTGRNVMNRIELACARVKRTMERRCKNLPELHPVKRFWAELHQRENATRLIAWYKTQKKNPMYANLSDDELMHIEEDKTTHTN